MSLVRKMMSFNPCARRSLMAARRPSVLWEMPRLSSKKKARKPSECLLMHQDMTTYNHVATSDMKTFTEPYIILNCPGVMPC